MFWKDARAEVIMSRMISGVLVMLILFAGCNNPQTESVLRSVAVEEAVARVSGDIVTLSLLSKAKADKPNLTTEQIVQGIIEEFLVYQAGKEMDIDVADEEVEARIDTLSKEMPDLYELCIKKYETREKYADALHYTILYWKVFDSVTKMYTDNYEDLQMDEKHNIFDAWVRKEYENADIEYTELYHTLLNQESITMIPPDTSSIFINAFPADDYEPSLNPNWFLETDFIPMTSVALFDYYGIDVTSPYIPTILNPSYKIVSAGLSGEPGLYQSVTSSEVHIEGEIYCDQNRIVYLGTDEVQHLDRTGKYLTGVQPRLRIDVWNVASLFEDTLFPSTLKYSNINDTKVLCGVYEDYDGKHYVAFFDINKTHLRLTADNIPEDEFIAVICAYLGQCGTL
jgi:hypothetical protein